MLKMYTVVELRSILGANVGMHCAFLGGSKAMCDPPPTGTDTDICIHVVDMDYAVEQLLDAGWELPDCNRCGYAGEYSSFRTLRKGEYNVLLFVEAYEFGAVWAATCVGKHLNIQCKDKRYKLFEVARAPWRGTSDA